jgi:hypothetical protein
LAVTALRCSRQIAIWNAGSGMNHSLNVPMVYNFSLPLPFPSYGIPAGRFYLAGALPMAAPVETSLAFAFC